MNIVSETNKFVFYNCSPRFYYMDNKYDFFIFGEYLEKKGIPFSDEAKNRLTLFYELLTEKNKVMNLTAITEWDEVLTRHFLDSISILEIKDLGDFHGKILDLGTGGGFPGIPLKIIFPELTMTLADSLNKRILFLQEVIEALGLKNIEAIHGRAEDLAKDAAHREKYDLVVSRAVANLSVLSEYCLPFTRMGGSFISYKTEGVEEELFSAENGIMLLGGSVKETAHFVLPHSDIKRSLVEIEKTKLTPKKYPRKAGTPTKEPL